MRTGHITIEKQITCCSSGVASAAAVCCADYGTGCGTAMCWPPPLPPTIGLGWICVFIPRHVCTFTDSSQRGATNIGSFLARHSGHSHFVRVPWSPCGIGLWPLSSRSTRLPSASGSPARRPICTLAAPRAARRSPAGCCRRCCTSAAPGAGTRARRGHGRIRRKTDAHRCVWGNIKKHFLCGSKCGSSSTLDDPARAMITYRFTRSLA